MPGEITKFLGFKIFAEFYQNSEISASNLCVFKKNTQVACRDSRVKAWVFTFSLVFWLGVCLLVIFYFAAVSRSPFGAHKYYFQKTIFRIFDSWVKILRYLYASRTDFFRISFSIPIVAGSRLNCRLQQLNRRKLPLQLPKYKAHFQAWELFNHTSSWNRSFRGSDLIC